MSRVASVQTVHVALEAVDEDVVVLAGEQYRAVLEVGSVNFGLQGEAEQEAVVASFAAFVNGLTFPVQILVWVLPINLDRYLGELERRAQRLPDNLADVAHDHGAFLRRLARNRTLLERRFYLVVPAQSPEGVLRVGWSFRSRPQTLGADEARRQLTFRCEEVARGLARCGLSVRRLHGLELTGLFYACWCPDLARTQRLVDGDVANTAAVSSPRPIRRA
jgi:hypothetical protein